MTPSLIPDEFDWKKTAVPTSISRVLICQYKSVQSIFLQEKEGQRGLPLFISLVEAMAIERKLRKEQSSRPFTHDLLNDIVRKMGGNFQNVWIYDMFNGNYYARLQLEHRKKVITFEVRPSDAIAMALCCNPPLDIYVDEALLI